MRRTERYRVKGANSLWNIYDTVSFWKVMKCFIIITIGRYTPFLRCEKLALSYVFENENWESNITRTHGHARYDVSRTHFNWR